MNKLNKIDFSGLLGIVVAVGAILLGQHLEGGHLYSLVNGPAFLIVLCGTVGAVIVETPINSLKQSLQMLRWIILPPPVSQESAVSKLVTWSHVARKEGLLGLESMIENERDPFTKKGLEILVDGTEFEIIRKILEKELEHREETLNAAAKVFESAGGYAPTIGIIGAVLGLIHVMSNLSDPSKLGGGIAVAFVATIYGVSLANIVFLPIANRLHRFIDDEQTYYNLYIDGFMGIAQGENPKTLEMKLSKVIKHV